MSNTYANHRIPEASLQFTGVNGTYFNESAFFFTTSVLQAITEIKSSIPESG